MKRAARAVVHGHVQGVGFRYFVSKMARRHNIHGWVKNTRTGSVEALLIGDEHSLDIMRQELQCGPGFARVRDVEWRAVADGIALESHNTFLIVG